MKKSLTAILLIGALATVGFSGACYSNQQVAPGGATQVTNLPKVPRNRNGLTVEQQMIQDRIDVTNDPTKVMWIHLISLDGKIIKRMPVAHKITSSGKRLVPVQAAEAGNGLPSFKGADGTIYYTAEFLQPDGTFGKSDDYVFWFDPQHRYHQWGTAGGLGYLLTDYPIDLTNQQDLITGMYNTDKAAYEWQKLQEALLCKQEGGAYDTQKGVCNK